MKILLQYIHLLSVAAAIGSAITVEFLIFKSKKQFDKRLFEIVSTSSHIVTISLVILWITGFGLVAVGYLDDPNYIMNQKIWAKVLIVFIFSLNGIYISRVVLPRLNRFGDGRMLSLSRRTCAAFSLSFAISSVGWLLSVFFGIAKFLNHSAGWLQLLGLYGFLVLVVFMCAFLVSANMRDARLRDKMA